MIYFFYVLLCLGWTPMESQLPTKIVPSNQEIAHPFHFSKCKIKYHAEDSTLQVTIILFLDDLELALHSIKDTSLFICDEIESPQTHALIGQYLNDRLHINIENDTLKRTFLGKECAKDNLSVWCYIELKTQGIPSIISLENRIFIELYGDQKNLVIVEFSKDRRIEKLLSANNVSATFED